VEEIGTGAGLAALGFWLFVAAMIAVGVWSSIRKRESQHETLRRIVESGQPIDEELTDKLLSLTGGAPSKHVDRDLNTSGLIVLSLAPGLFILGWFMSRGVAAEMLYIMSGVSALMVLLGVGFLVAAYVVRRYYSDEDDNGTQSPV